MVDGRHCWLRRRHHPAGFHDGLRSLPSADDIGDDALYQSGIRRLLQGADELERAEDGARSTHEPVHHRLAGVVHSQGIINGIYTVRVQYPVSLKLDGQERSLPAANYIIELTIQQTDPREKPSAWRSGRPS
ncbi:hypothetical protein GSH13_30710 (plasmid) [Klebsiella pneumoniae]|nr:hypothetical protein GSH13_30710 [Klebsiella pneumoniae]